MATDFVRRCPSCDTENPADSMRCVCGAMLLGVDISPRNSSSPVTPTASVTAPASAMLRCPYDDCGQPNLAGAVSCVYCARPLAAPVAGSASNPVTHASGDSADDNVSLPASLLARYTPIRNLPTHGAEADLVLVESKQSGELRLVKLFRVGLSVNAAVSERVEKMALRHRLNCFERGTAGGRFYEVLEYCRSGSLRDVFEESSHRPLLSITEVAAELNNAIAAAHANQLVHRDIKPDNVLVRSKVPLQLILIDFGIASILDATQRFTGAARTLMYASPESLSGVIDGKTDYWALGMILLEAETGHHPFAGLSDAVILHHLATRNIDLSGVSDPGTRKLLKGLLLRDPQKRWGESEVSRWLQGDATLAEPADAAMLVQFTEPYHLGKQQCHTAEQLAVALAAHWKEGVADLNNGQLLSWFSNVQKDQNTIRLLLDFQQDARLPGDVRLLHLLIHLYPALPPVWRGESIELPAIFRCVARALHGEEGAMDWLSDLYERGVVAAYGKAGNKEAKELDQRWRNAAASFEAAWQKSIEILNARSEASAAAVPSFDDLMFGRIEPDRPDLRRLHGQLLASVYDAHWVAQLRERLSIDVVQSYVQSSRLAALGDPKTLDAPALLVLNELLPRVQKVAAADKEALAQRHALRTDEVRAMSDEAKALIAQIQTMGRSSSLDESGCSDLKSALEKFFALLARVEMMGIDEEAVLTLRKSMKRFEPTAARMIRLVDSLAERFLSNSGWMSPDAVTFVTMAVLFLPVTFSVRALYFVIPAVIGVAIWRLYPPHMLRRKIRALASL